MPPTIIRIVSITIGQRHRDALVKQPAHILQVTTYNIIIIRDYSNIHILCCKVSLDAKVFLDFVIIQEANIVRRWEWIWVLMCDICGISLTTKLI
jgi:hypothetical protein